MKFLFVALFLLLTPSLATGATPWETVAEAHRVSGWDDVEVLSFSWKHKSGKQRSYQWWVKKHVIRVTIDGETFDIPHNAARLEGERELAAHKAFINDSFWLLFELHLQWDEPTREDLAAHDSPFGGKAPAFRVTYPATGGHTPGDSYIAFLGQDRKVMGWSYVPAGASSAKLTTTRGSYEAHGPLILPTRFETPDGELFIEITDIRVR